MILENANGHERGEVFNTEYLRRSCDSAFEHQHRKEQRNLGQKRPWEPIAVAIVHHIGRQEGTTLGMPGSTTIPRLSHG